MLKTVFPNQGLHNQVNNGCTLEFEEFPLKKRRIPFPEDAQYMYWIENPLRVSIYNPLYRLPAVKLQGLGIYAFNKSF